MIPAPKWKAIHDIFKGFAIEFIEFFEKVRRKANYVDVLEQLIATEAFRIKSHYDERFAKLESRIELEKAQAQKKERLFDDAIFHSEKKYSDVSVKLKELLEYFYTLPTAEGLKARIEDLEETESASDYLKTDEIAGRVSRTSDIYIQDGTNANTIKVTTASIWNADSGGPDDNLGKGATVGDHSLDATGSILTIDCQAIGGASGAHIINPQTAFIVEDQSGATVLRVKPNVSGTDLQLTFSDQTGAKDLTALVDVGEIRVRVSTYTAE